MFHPFETLEFLYLVAPCLRDHPQLIPVRSEGAAGSRPHDVSLQDLQSYVYVQGVIRLVQFQKYHAQDIVPHGC